MSEDEKYLRFIESEWNDIHHARTQDWVSLGILAIFTLALFSTPFLVQVPLLMAAVLTAILGSFQAYRHWALMQYKIRGTITESEKKANLYQLGPFHETRLPVQGAILTVYVVISGAYFSWLVWVLNAITNAVPPMVIWIFIYALEPVLFVGALVFSILYKGKLAEEIDAAIQHHNRKVNNDNFQKEVVNGTAPTFAMMHDGDSDSQRSHGHICKGRSEYWILPQNSILSVTPSDHDYLIYASEANLVFIHANSERAIEPSVVLVPPNMEHKVRTTGLTFAFKVTSKMPYAYTPEWPKEARLDKISECLNGLGDRPLKLVAHQKRDDEEDWGSKQVDWAFKSNPSGGISRKDILLNTVDDFAFSVANQYSRQTFHFHEGSFEAYASNNLINALYEKSDGLGQEGIRRGGGIMIFPPNAVHKVELGCLTFVLQVSSGGAGVSNDKKLKHLPPIATIPSK